MPWRIKIFFYLSLGLSLSGLIFPIYVTQAIGFDIGDMVHWIYGFYILIPRNPVGEPKLYFSFQGFFLLISAIVLLVVSFVELRNAKLGNRYNKNLIYVIAIIQLMFVLYQLARWIVMYLSIWGFFFSVLFALIGSKELNLFYIDKGIVNVKKERKLGVVLITISLVFLIYSISTILLCGGDVFSLSFATNLFPFLILLLIMLFYGINSLIRAKNKNRSKLQ